MLWVLEHRKQMFKLMDMKIITILSKLFSLNLPYEVSYCVNFTQLYVHLLNIIWYDTRNEENVLTKAVRKHTFFNIKIIKVNNDNISYLCGK